MRLPTYPSPAFPTLLSSIHLSILRVIASIRPLPIPLLSMLSAIPVVVLTLRD